MKNILTGIIVMSAFTFSAQAQVQRNANDSDKTKSADRNVKDGMKDKLNLTASQKEQMKAINEEFREKLQAVIRNESLSPDQRRTQREALNEEKNKKILAILTPAQKTIFIESRKNQGTGNLDNKGKGQIEEMRVALGLSDDQVARIRSNNDAFLQKERAIYDNRSLTADEKDNQLDNLRRDKDQSLKEVLTASQASKWDALKGKGEWKEKSKGDGIKEKMKIKNS